MQLQNSMPGQGLPQQLPQPIAPSAQFGGVPTTQYAPIPPKPSPIKPKVEAEPEDEGEPRPGKAKMRRPQEQMPGTPPKLPDKQKVKDVFQSYLETAKTVLISPNYFFEGMPREGGLQGPAIFLAINASAGCLVQMVFTRDPLTSLGTLLVMLFVFVFMARGLEYLLKQFGGKGNFEETFRVLCYSSPPIVLVGVQWLAPFALCYLSVLWFVGLRRVHDIQF
jgi:hypothetical protein